MMRGKIVSLFLAIMLNQAAESGTVCYEDHAGMSIDGQDLTVGSDPGSTLEECWTSCLATSGCVAVTFRTECAHKTAAQPIGVKNNYDSRVLAKCPTTTPMGEVTTSAGTTLAPECWLLPGSKLSGSVSVGSTDPGESRESCRALCFAEPACTAAVRNFNTGRCYLKNATDPLASVSPSGYYDVILLSCASTTRESASTSAARPCWLHPASVVDGSNLIPFFGVISYEECRDRCAMEPGCTSANMNPVSMNCALKIASDPLNNMSPSTDYDVIVPGCEATSTPAPPPQVTTEVSTTTQTPVCWHFPGSSFPGIADIGVSGPGQSRESCRAFCAAEPACTAASLEKDPGICHLKNVSNPLASLVSSNNYDVVLPSCAEASTTKVEASTVTPLVEGCWHYPGRGLGGAATVWASGPGETAGSCRALCAADPACTVASLKLSTGVCYLKNVTNPLARLTINSDQDVVLPSCGETTTTALAESTTSGEAPTSSAAPCWLYPGTVVSGTANLIPFFSVASHAECRDRCTAEPGCTSANINPTSMNCALKDTSDPLINTSPSTDHDLIVPGCESTSTTGQSTTPVEASTTPGPIQCFLHFPFQAAGGVDLFVVPNVGYIDCAKLCETDSACLASQYDISSRACHLKNSTAMTTATGVWDSFAPGCGPIPLGSEPCDRMYLHVRTWTSTTNLGYIGRQNCSRRCHQDAQCTFAYFNSFGQCFAGTAVDPVSDLGPAGANNVVMVPIRPSPSHCGGLGMTTSTATTATTMRTKGSVVSTTTGPVVSTTESPPRCFLHTPDHDGSGGNIRSEGGHNFLTCAELCDAEPSCRGGMLSATTDSCFLKDATDSWYRPGVFMFYIPGCDPNPANPTPCNRVYAHRGILGSALGSLSGLSVEQCSRLCHSDPACTAATYSNVTGSCLLQDTAEPLAEMVAEPSDGAVFVPLRPSAGYCDVPEPPTTLLTTTPLPTENPCMNHTPNSDAANGQHEISVDTGLTYEACFASCRAHPNCTLMITKPGGSLCVLKDAPLSTITGSATYDVTVDLCPKEAHTTLRTHFPDGTSTMATTSLADTTETVSTAAGDTTSFATTEHSTTEAHPTSSAQVDVSASAAPAAASSATTETWTATPTAGATEASTSGGETCCQRLENRRIHGDDLTGGVGGLDEAACCQWCQDRSDCTAAVFQKVTLMCYPKDSTDPLAVTQGSSSHTTMVKSTNCETTTEYPTMTPELSTSTVSASTTLATTTATTATITVTRTTATTTKTTTAANGITIATTATTIATRTTATSAKTTTPATAPTTATTATRTTTPASTTATRTTATTATTTVITVTPTATTAPITATTVTTITTTTDATTATTTGSVNATTAATTAERTTATTTTTTASTAPTTATAAPTIATAAPTTATAAPTIATTTDATTATTTAARTTATTAITTATSAPTITTTTDPKNATTSASTNETTATTTATTAPSTATTVTTIATTTDATTATSTATTATSTATTATTATRTTATTATTTATNATTKDATTATITATTASTTATRPTATTAPTTATSVSQSNSSQSNMPTTKVGTRISSPSSSSSRSLDEYSAEASHPTSGPTPGSASSDASLQSFELSSSSTSFASTSSTEMESSSSSDQGSSESFLTSKPPKQTAASATPEPQPTSGAKVMTIDWGHIRSTSIKLKTPLTSDMDSSMSTTSIQSTYSSSLAMSTSSSNWLESSSPAHTVTSSTSATSTSMKLSTSNGEASSPTGNKIATGAKATSITSEDITAMPSTEPGTVAPTYGAETSSMKTLLSSDALRALEKYAGDVVPVDVVASVGRGEEAQFTAWLDTLEPQPSDRDFEELKAGAEETGLPQSLVAAVEDQRARRKVREAIADMAGLSLDEVDPTVAAGLMSGDTGKLRELIENSPEQPSKSSFDDIMAATGDIIFSEAKSELEKLQRELIPLEDATVSAIEVFAAQPLPADIAQAFASADSETVNQWLDSLSPKPTQNETKKLLQDESVPESIRKLIQDWADPPMTPEAVAEKVAGALGREVPQPVVDELKEGKAEALTDWLAAEGPILPSAAQWAQMDLPEMPAEIRASLESYEHNQYVLEEIAKLASVFPDDIPSDLAEKLLTSSDPEPLLNWIVEQDIKPSSDAWEVIEANLNLSPGVQGSLATLKDRLCQGPFAAPWSPWSPCPVSCGRGKRSRSRRRAEASCPLETEALFCHAAFCPVHCAWGPWGGWGQCSKSCGEGVLTRYRKREAEASERGAPCEGSRVQTKSCSGDQCADTTLAPDVISSLAQAGIDPEDAKDSAAFSTAALDTIPFLIGNMSLEDKIGLGHTLDGTISLCAYNGVRCPREDFRTFYDESLGNCFTFNFPQPAKYWTKRPGATRGLTMLLSSQQAEYLCTSQLGGFKVMVHNQTERPFADAMGFNVAPGKTTSVSLSQMELLKQPPPYGSCTAVKDGGFLYNGSHTMEGCLRSCYQATLVGLCGCADPRLTLPEGAPVCGPEKKLMLDFYRNCREEGGENPMECAQCTNPCRSYQFQVTTSSGLMYDTQAYDKICAVSSADPGTAGGCASDHAKQRNFALIKVYYERMNLVRHEEMPDYSLANLVSDFAGVLGIAVGASVVTMLEVLWAAAGLLLHCLTKHRVSIVGG